MRSTFKKRFLAYSIDMFIFILVISTILYFIPMTQNQNELNKEILHLQEELITKRIPFNDYINQYGKLIPLYDKENIAGNICELVFILGYFVLIPLFNEGQTLGKKLMKIKLKKITGNLTIKDMILRNFITTSLLQLMVSSIFIYILNPDNYFVIINIIGFLQIIVAITTIFMIIYRKDKRGLQDFITNSEVVEVENERIY